MELTDTKVTFGPQKAVLTLKGFEQKDSSETKDNNLAGRVDYKIDEIGYQGKAVGSAAMAVSMKNVDIPAMLVLTKLYQDKMQPVQAAAAAGQPVPELQMTEAEQALAEANVNQVLAAKPQLAVENLSLKTTRGESKFNLVVDLTKPTSMELPPVELGKQMVSLLDANLTLSADDQRRGGPASPGGRRDRPASHRTAIADGGRDGQQHGGWHPNGDPGGYRRGFQAALRQQRSDLQRPEDDR